MPTVTPNFHFDGCCANAIAFYEKNLGAITTYRLTYGEAGGGSAEQAGWIYHAEMRIAGQCVWMSDGAAEAPGNTLSLAVTFDTAEEVRAAYAGMSQGCTVIHPMQSTGYSPCFVSFIDAYGMRWELLAGQAG